jgi:predicted DNA-binding transcriptional regulator
MPVFVDKLFRMEKLLKQKKKDSVKIINSILKSLGFNKIEITIYDLLLKKSLTIKQIKKEINVTERCVRNHIKGLLRKGFIERTIISGKRLKYTYKSISIKKVWEKLKKEVADLIDEINRSLTLI